METKTCSICGLTFRADFTHFGPRNRKRKDGTVLRTLRSACRGCECGLAKVRMAEKRARIPTYNSEAKRRQRQAADYKLKKNKYERERRARVAGYASHADREVAVERTAAVKSLAGTLRTLAQKVKAEQRKPWQQPGITQAQAWRLRYRIDPEFNLAERIRRQLTKRAKRDGVAELMRRALRDCGESSAVQARLGYTIAQLREHIERQFTAGMNWVSFAAGEIHIDHITPQAHFDLRNDADWRACWSLGNLRPMWAKDNWAKSDARHFLL